VRDFRVRRAPAKTQKIQDFEIELAALSAALCAWHGAAQVCASTRCAITVDPTAVANRVFEMARRRVLSSSYDVTVMWLFLR
jgi:hypothetical protein